MLDSLFNYKLACELRHPLLPYVITLIFLSTVNVAIASRDEAVSLSGQSFELRLNDDREGNIFYATLNFVGTEAVWRFRSRHDSDSHSIQGRGTVEVSGFTAVFNDGKGDWFLEFSPDYRKVHGTYQFWQERPGKPRTRHYEVTGITSEGFSGWPGLQ